MFLKIMCLDLHENKIFLVLKKIEKYLYTLTASFQGYI